MKHTTKGLVLSLAFLVGAAIPLAMAADAPADTTATAPKAVTAPKPAHKLRTKKSVTPKNNKSGKIVKKVDAAKNDQKKA